MCAVASQAHTDVPGAGSAFYAGPENPLHELASVLASGHATQSKAVLTAIQAFEADVAAKPPPASSGADADLVVAASKDGLTVLKVTPPNC